MNNNLFLTKRFIKNNNNNNNNNWLIILTTALNVNYKNNYEDMNKRRNLCSTNLKMVNIYKF